jgi:hypothetical protein
MPHARNAPTETRCDAVLSLAEYCVRGDVTPKDLSDEDREFMDQSADMLCRDLNVLRRQAAAQSTDAWREVLDSAHSMRCVTIDRDRKDERRQRMFRCDGCGRQEKWCGLAIDLAGRPNMRRQPWTWLSKQPTLIGGDREASERWPWMFAEFHKDYLSDLANPEACDMGRFYLGNTCHRKAQLCFIANTMVQETLYNAREMLAEGRNDGAELETTELYTVDVDAPVEFMERKEQLELCVADEKRSDMPDVMVDGGFWDNIDEHRLDLTDDEIRQKATDALEKAGEKIQALATSDGEMSDDDEDEFVPSGDDAEEEDDELEGVQHVGEAAAAAAVSRDALSRRLGKRPVGGPTVDDGDRLHVNGPPKKRLRSRVIEDDEDDDGNEPALDTTKGTVPVRRSRRVQNKSPEKEEVAAAPAQKDDDPDEPDESDGSDEDVMVSSLRNPNLPPPMARSALERRSAPPSAVEVARNMRIPRIDGTQRLPSRQGVLLGLVNVQRDLILKRENGLAAQVGAAVLTMQELMEIAERSHVGQ